MLFGIVILNFLVFTNWFGELRSRIGLHLLGFGTKKNLLKTDA